MREVERKYGIPAITFDEMLADPEAARRRMTHLLRGAGAASPDQGVSFAGAVALASDANYDFETAIYELIDNSFAADANNVVVTIHTNADNKVDLKSLEGTSAKFSIGKSF